MRALSTTAVGLLLALTACQSPPAPEGPSVPEPKRTVGIQLFQYNWPSVAKQCTDVLGPSDFAFVLVSPAQEHIAGDQWWTSYQPVSYKIESKLGTREEFRQMVEACHGAGVQVIADAVLNHMAGVESGTGVAGTAFTHYEYPGLYGPDDFHHCKLTDGDDIANYSDQQQVQECELSNLADLDTGSKKVQETIGRHLQDLASLGVDGFRIDATKHMARADVAAILSHVPEGTRIIQEVIRSSGEPIQPEDYLEGGGVFAFQWARDVTGIVKGGSLQLAMTLKDGMVPSEQAYTFVANHDTERGQQTLAPRDGAEFTQAEMLAIATDYGTPVLYSGYVFSDRDAGAPSTNGRVDDARCATSDTPADGEFRCLDDALAALAKWRAQVGDAPIANQAWDDSVLSMDRGQLGLIALSSHTSDTQTVERATGLPDGTYCDVLSDDCSFVVADGKVRLNVPSMGAVALDVAHRAKG